MTIGLASLLAACGTGSAESMAYASDVDGTTGIVKFTCNSSSSGRCLFKMDEGGQQASAAVGETATLSEIKPGTSYCARTRKDGNCFRKALITGHQVIRHEVRHSG